MDLIEHFWDLTTVSDANNKSYQIWYIPRVIISRISFSKRCSLQYVIKLSMPRVDTLGTELLFTVFPWTLKLILHVFFLKWHYAKTCFIWMRKFIYFVGQIYNYMYFTVFISYKTNIEQQRVTLSFIPLSKGEISNFHEVVRFLKLYTTEKQRIQWSFIENDFQPIFYFAIQCSCS